MATHPVVACLGSVTQFDSAPIASTDRTTFTQTYSTAGTTVAAATTATLVNSTTGSAANTLAAGVGVSTVAIPVNLASVANGDVLTNYVPGYAFKILSVSFAVSVPVTTAAKATTLNLEIGTTDLTGGAIALTSANCTPLGALVAGSSITAANTGTATDNVSIEAASTTAFVEGAGYVLIKIQNMDTANAHATFVREQAALAADILDRTKNLNSIIDALQLPGIAL